MMFTRLLDKIAGDYNKKQLDIIQPIVDKINEYYEKWHDLTDDEVKNKTSVFKERLSKGETLDDILPEAYAVVKQACKRMFGKTYKVKGNDIQWDMIPYDVQLVCGVILFQGKIGELKTGEGKTLVATLAAYLHALEGKGVHIVTVNDYLASRDEEWMGHLYSWLGLTHGSITKSVAIHKRREIYERDIVYVENSELGFDYLRDNLTKTIEERNLVWRPLNYAIIDEVDSILIDEARTPLIISQASEVPTEKYGYYSQLVQLLKPCKGKKKVPRGLLKELLSDDKEEKVDDDGDYHIDEKTKSVTLSSNGIQKLEGMLKIENLYKDLGYEEIHHIENALRANAVYIKDKDYIVRGNEVLIVDEHTGRTMPGRRYSEGLHQAIEAKEKVQIQKESKTLATITYQHFFKQYAKLSGMTGTATTEGEEFEKIYGLEVVAVPTNRLIIRADKNDKVFFNQNSKWKFVIDNVKFYHEMGVPILLGTSSIETSEFVSNLLRQNSIHHYVLNAKFHEQEAEIVSNAGKLSSVVVATNMAGRGTDIKLEKGLFDTIQKNYLNWIQDTIEGKGLDGKGPAGVRLNIVSKDEFDIITNGLKDKFNLNDEDIENSQKGDLEKQDSKLLLRIKTSTNSIYFSAIIDIRPLGVQELEIIEKDINFGLYILGTEKHDSRRIDNQLRGRSGRQGDPGVTQFFVALDDEIMRKMGGEKIQSIARMLMSKEDLEDMELTQKQFTNSIERAQKQMEGWHFGIRKHLFDYDSVINKQRSRIYKKRDDLLFLKLDEEGKSEELMNEIKSFIEDIINKLITTYTATRPWNSAELIETIAQFSGIMFDAKEIKKYNSAQDRKLYLIMKLSEEFDIKLANNDKLKLSEVIRLIYLDIIDKYWIEHIDDLQYLREQVALYGYAQENPLVIYKKEAYDKFQKLLFNIKQEVLANMMKGDFAFLNQEQVKPESRLNIDLGFPKEEGIVDLLKGVVDNISSEDIEYVKKQMEKDESEEKSLDQKIIEISSGKKAKVLESNNDIEVFEVKDEDEKSSEEGDVEVITRSSGNKKTRPNDPCYCGSGKKFKKCHGKK